MPRLSEFLVASAMNAVPEARRFAAGALDDVVGDAIDNVQLLVSELVTNALFHGQPPVLLRLIQQDHTVRVEVEDTGHALPVEMASSGESMTGRGLALVSTLSSGWGVQRTATGGKVVWAQLSDAAVATDGHAAPEMDVEDLLAYWASDEQAEQLYEVRLGSAPTALLLEAKSHIENLVRELTLAKAGEAAKGTSLPVAMAEVVTTVISEFSEARTEIKRQALAAASRGEATTELVINLPISAADAGERYLAALDEADRYARAARLLTLAAPRSHQIFRRWYVQSLIDQLRAVAKGDRPTSPEPFTSALAGEVERLSKLEDSWAKLQLLQKVTADLTRASGPQEAAQTVVDNAFEFLGVETARVFLLGDDQVLRSIAVRGGDPDLVPRYQEFPIEAELPGTEVIRTGKPMLLRNVAEIRRRFPELVQANLTERSLHLAPLIIGEKTLGLFNLSFPGASDIDERAQVEFVGALADALAQALERTLAMQRAMEANDRLSFLADASVALSGTLDYQGTLDAVTSLLVPRLADWCLVQLVNGDELTQVAIQHADRKKVESARVTGERYPTKLDARTGLAAVARTGQSVVLPTVPRRVMEMVAADDEQLEAIQDVGMSSVMLVPLIGRGGVIGVVTLMYAESGRHYAHADVPFVEDVARRAALALETAGRFREQSGRLAKVTRVADVVQRAILAPPPRRLGSLLLAARYVSAAAEARVGGDLYEVVRRPNAVRMLIGDVRGKGLAAVRTATIVLGEFRAAAVDIADLRDVAEHIDRRIQPYLGDEDFVTATIAEVTDDGQYSLVSCGHPPALLSREGCLRELKLEHALPLGLGTLPTVHTGHMSPGDRLLLYTDGITESRLPDGRFIDLARIARPLADTELTSSLDVILTTLRQAVGSEPADDIALLAAEYRPEAAEGR
jgi:serine phosphatase RsbU (regulator of sigma subunit)/anti-sigma regulatory factor (Ser/Thr protein kinase)